MTTLIIFLILILLVDFYKNEQNKGYELKIKMYKSIFNLLFSSGNLDKFEIKMRLIGLEKTPRIFNIDKKSYFIEFILPTKEKIVTEYLYMSDEVIRIVFLHKTDVYSHIKSYIENSYVFDKENNIWYNPENTLSFSYEITHSAKLSICYRGKVY